MIVVDTNLIVHLLLETRETAAAERVFAADPEWLAPMLWRSELRNALAQQVKAGHLELAVAIRLTETAEELLEGNEFLVATPPVLELAERSGCSAYDCEFVAVAKHQEVPLVTSDRQLLRAFPESTVSPRDFAATVD